MSKRRIPPDTAAYAALTELNYTTTDSVSELQIEWELEPTGILDGVTALLVMDMVVARRIGQRENTHILPRDHGTRNIRFRL